MTWLVPSGLIPLLIKQARIDVKFFQQHRIQKVTVGNECAYEDSAEESTLVGFPVWRLWVCLG